MAIRMGVGGRRGVRGGSCSVSFLLSFLLFSFFENLKFGPVTDFCAMVAGNYYSFPSFEDFQEYLESEDRK